MGWLWARISVRNILIHPIIQKRAVLRPERSMALPIFFHSALVILHPPAVLFTSPILKGKNWKSLVKKTKSRERHLENYESVFALPKFLKTFSLHSIWMVRNFSVSVDVALYDWIWSWLLVSSFLLLAIQFWFKNFTTWSHWISIVILLFLFNR